LVLWNGNKGQTYFYQAEYPYDVDSSYASAGYAGYHVADNVTEHQAHGVGVYSFFRDHEVNMALGIKTPTGSGISFTNSLSVFLNGKGSINHVINDQGARVAAVNSQQYICSYPSSEVDQAKEELQIFP